MDIQKRPKSRLVDWQGEVIDLDKLEQKEDWEMGQFTGLIGAALVAISKFVLPEADESQIQELATNGAALIGTLIMLFSPSLISKTPKK